jgi:hypothetical protein
MRSIEIGAGQGTGPARVPRSSQPASSAEAGEQLAVGDVPCPKRRCRAAACRGLAIATSAATTSSTCT